MKTRKTLCIDINSIVPLYVNNYVSGIGRTTLELIETFAQIKDQLPFEFILYTQNMKGITGKTFHLPFKNKHIYLRNKPVYNQLIAGLHLKESLINYDLFHIPHNFDFVARPEKTVLTIHDALFFAYPESFLGHDSARKNYPELAQKCKAIITCSESSKRDIVKYMGVSEEKITMIHWGVSTQIFYPETAENTQQLTEKYNLQHPFFIMVSCDIGRKNTELLMENYRNYRKQGGKYDLVLIWKNPPVEVLQKYSEEIENQHIRFFSGINENELRIFYSAAAASFFPSKYEGFGLPVLESMACGTPVVTCRNSSLEEVGGEAAFYVSSESEHDMATYMHDFEQGIYDLEDLKKKSLRHIENFTWRKAARKYVKFYEKYI
ncbi:glycosyl transferase family 1 [Bacteroidia bacterium]|nr:glycosyl transferase family 1 [Bacteroidia bacterium]